MNDEGNSGQSRPSAPPPQPGDPYEIPPEGSLGLLATGYRGLQAWRNVRDETLDEVETAHGPEARRRHPAAPNIPDPDEAANAGEASDAESSDAVAANASSDSPSPHNPE